MKLFSRAITHSIFTFIFVVALNVSTAKAQQEDLLTACGAGMGGLPTPWSYNINDIFYLSGLVGIGTHDPKTTLDVDGTIRGRDYINCGRLSTNANGDFQCSNTTTAATEFNEDRCYVIRPASNGGGICRKDFYQKGAIQFQVGGSSVYGPICCTSNNNPNYAASTLLTINALLASCPWGLAGVNCNLNTATFPAGY